MADDVIETSAGTYGVDWSLATEVVSAFHRSRCAAETAKVSTTNERAALNPFSWGMPDVRNVEVDWQACTKMAAVKTAQDMASYRRAFVRDAPAVVSEIYGREISIATNRDRLQRMMAEAQRFNSASFEASDKKYENAIAVTRFIRDASAGTLVLGSAFVTGGTSLALLGTGSVLTGTAKYQDTGNVAAGVIAGGGTMVIGYFGMAGRGLQMSSNAKNAIIVAKGTLETVTGLTAGDSLGDALISGGSKIVAEGVMKHVFNADVVKAAFRNMPMPVKIQALGGIRARGFMTKSLGREFAAGITKWSASKSVAGVTKEVLKGGGHHQTASYGPLAEATPIPSSARTSMAFVKLR